MRALIVDGSAPGRVTIRDVPDPTAGPGEVLVDVRAFSLNRGEARALLTASEGHRPGWDFAGVVLAGVDGGPRAGARVVGIKAGGTWAEKVSIRSDWLAEIPDEVSFAQAAALPTAGLTGLRTLRLGPAILGRRVLITGASGGVGRFAVQLAHLGGAHVTALVGNPLRVAEIEALGGDEVTTDIELLRGRFDLIVDSVGGPLLGRLITMIDPSGTLVMFGNTSDEPTTFNVRDVYNDALVRLQGFELFYGMEPFGRDLATLARLVAEGRLDPQVAGELPWGQLPEALDRLRARAAGGKLVLTTS